MVKVHKNNIVLFSWFCCGREKTRNLWSQEVSNHRRDEWEIKFMVERTRTGQNIEIYGRVKVIEIVHTEDNSNKLPEV